MKRAIDDKKVTQERKNLDAGRKIVSQHPIFGCHLAAQVISDSKHMGKNNASYVTSDGEVYLNEDYFLTPKQWAYVLAHCFLHLCFGHFDRDRMPLEKEVGNKKLDIQMWNKACDMYVANFLSQIKFGEPICNVSFPESLDLTDEIKIYQYLLENDNKCLQEYGTASIHSLDMHGLEKPMVYEKGRENPFMIHFANVISHAALNAVVEAGGHEKVDNQYSYALKARDWFLDRFPLLGALASVFEIITSAEECYKLDISIAAIDIGSRKIYVNEAAYLTLEELRFVLAHELLHAGLCHHERCHGRESFLWNVACDFVINGWLKELQVGSMPEGVLFDEKYEGWSAESIYDELVLKLRKNSKLNTLRGYGMGDIIGSGRKPLNGKDGISVDEFCKKALMQGLMYHEHLGRGFLPAGLVEEINALSMPPIPWDVEMADWFNECFPDGETVRTYARASRRQGSTPDIPRPGRIKPWSETSKTFAAIIDTSGSMSKKMIAMALGSIASLAASKEISYVRVVFCDAKAYDAGYMAPNDIAGRVEVKGRGGTRIQPGIDLIEKAEDFPDEGPVLIITDGMIEDNLRIRREHAYLLPAGFYLPFIPKGKVFHLNE